MGMATLTIVAVRMTAIEAISEVSVTNQRCAASRREGGASLAADIDFQLDHHAGAQ